MINPYIQTSEGTVKAGGLKLRGHVQRQRVKHGLQNGSITQEELGQLKEARQEAFGALTQSKGDDGKVGIFERLASHGDLNDISKMIHEFKHN